jgi:large subunit ribosomal protein L3
LLEKYPVLFLFMKFILAKKLGMTTIYEEGDARNVTLLEAGKNLVVQLRSVEKDGYSAIQAGLVDDRKTDGKKNVFLKKSEFKVEGSDLKVGDEISVEQFQKDEKVDVIATSKGKGYQGVMKRHNFKGSPATHGHRHDHRAPGSIGSAFPERVMKGKKMSGRMGSDRNTVRNMKVVLVDKEKGILALEGAVPGTNGSIVRVVGN